MMISSGSLSFHLVHHHLILSIFLLWRFPWNLLGTLRSVSDYLIRLLWLVSSSFSSHPPPPPRSLPTDQRSAYCVNSGEFRPFRHNIRVDQLMDRGGCVVVSLSQLDWPAEYQKYQKQQHKWQQLFTRQEDIKEDSNGRMNRNTVQINLPLVSLLSRFMANQLSSHPVTATISSTSTVDQREDTMRSRLQQREPPALLSSIPFNFIFRFISTH